MTINRDLNNYQLQTSKIMKKRIYITLLFSILLNYIYPQQSFIFVEAESFKDKGGWVIDQQSIDVIGSSYLMAHGLGVPVLDAKTTINIPQGGEYRVWVRTRNWAAPWNPEADPHGKFQLLINGELKSLMEKGM